MKLNDLTYLVSKKFKNVPKWQIKLFLVVFALIIVVFIIYYTEFLISDLIEREKRIIKSYTNIYQKIINNEIQYDAAFSIVEELSSNITFPMISTDEKDMPNYPFMDYSRNIYLNPKLTTKEQKEIMISYINKMKKDYPPILLKEKNGKVIQKFYYSNSQFITFLQYFPFFAIGLVSIFIIIGYVGFRNIRQNEESKVWVGMSKEAAHQLGTPLSSLLAWLEILRIYREDEANFNETINEIEKDLSRLNVIATRFSKIGSTPQLKEENLNHIIENCCLYFDKRLPHIQRKIRIIRNFKSEFIVKVNTDLFMWVIENLIKNAIESIDTQFGEVEIEVKKQDEMVVINVTDNGKGMTNKVRKQVFNPGFTTKKRGWGLGLSLCKRIIEQYHNGRIFIKDSQIGRGTIFTIELPRK